MKLIPAIDLRAGHCVRLLHGDFEAETRYPIRTPCSPSIAAQARTGCTSSISTAPATVRWTIRAIIVRTLGGAEAVDLQVGGGLRNTAALAQMLDAGVARAWSAVRRSRRSSKCRRGLRISARSA